MIVLPRGWAVTHHADGVVLVHPGGPDVATIEYRERVRPLRDAGAVLRQLETGLPAPDHIERLTTVEGEYAALATMHGHGEQHDVGIVFGDDFYARVWAVCRDREQHAVMTQLVRGLVLTDTHMLGIRRRRFEYTPPSGWQPITRSFITDWLAPAFPRDGTWLSVYPAIPVELAPPALVGERVTRVELDNGLAGVIADATLQVGERRVAKLRCMLRDRTYAYSLEATGDASGLEAHRDELVRVVESVQPLPSPRPAMRATIHHSLHAFWME